MPVTDADKYIIADVMSKVLIDVASDTTAGDAAEIMIENGVSSLLVKDSGTIVGIVTDRDFTRETARKSSFDSLTLRDMMSTDLVSVAPTISLQEAVETIREHNIRHLLVKTADDEYIGMVSVKELLSVLFEEIRQQNIRLKGKIAELEKFYKVAVDRELVMVKLKKRIYELEKTLGVESDLAALLTE
ncbi:MAG TPA: CBS domain-containing protein [Euryarchaeota archaeon]|nr:CBS domain-containing protein [Euryarchaeota archaeon]